MTNNNSMTVITSKPFGGLNVDVYEDSKHEYYMTREQIGQALEYGDPVRNISKIHDRNADRLNPLSSVVDLTTEVGNYTQTRQTYVYNLRGVMEICRFSRQPKADKFMDFCWDVMESLMRGDSVLASPKMDAALTPDFIQAQFVALMEKQADLDKKMKYLNDRMGRVFDKMEDTRGLVNETLATVSSVSTAVQKIKEKQADDSIRTKSYTPRREPMSNWRRDMYDKINTIAKIREMQVPDVFHDIYAYMNKVYSFVVEEEERKKYKEKTGRTYNITTIEIVEASEMYKSIFGALVKDLYAEALDSKKQNFFDQPKAIEAAPEVNVAVAPVVEVEVREVESALTPVAEKKPKTQSETARILVPILKPYADMIGDKPVYKHTYYLIYEQIGYTKMNKMMAEYARAHGTRPSPKGKMFLNNEKNMDEFKKAVKELIRMAKKMEEK